MNSETLMLFDYTCESNLFLSLTWKLFLHEFIYMLILNLTSLLFTTLLIIPYPITNKTILLTPSTNLDREVSTHQQERLIKSRGTNILRKQPIKRERKKNIRNAKIGFNKCKLALNCDMTCLTSSTIWII